MTIHYKTGDATRPDERNCILVHCCNNIGRWGSGFTLAVDKTFGTQVGEAYRAGQWHHLGKIFPMTMHPRHNVWYIVNLVGQAGVKGPTVPTPVQYNAIREGLGRLDEWMRATGRNVPVVMPRIGAGLAGGSWRKIETVIYQTMLNRDVYVYDLPGAVEGKDWNL